MLKLPKVVYVSVKGGDSQWLEANSSAIDCIEDDGPTRVGTYRLVEVNEMSKEAVAKKSR